MEFYVDDSIIQQIVKAFTLKRLAANYLHFTSEKNPESLTLIYKIKHNGIPMIGLRY